MASLSTLNSPENAPAAPDLGILELSLDDIIILQQMSDIDNEEIGWLQTPERNRSDSESGNSKLRRNVEEKNGDGKYPSGFNKQYFIVQDSWDADCKSQSKITGQSVENKHRSEGKSKAQGKSKRDRHHLERARGHSGKFGNQSTKSHSHFGESRDKSERSHGQSGKSQGCSKRSHGRSGRPRDKTEKSRNNSERGHDKYKRSCDESERSGHKSERSRNKSERSRDKSARSRGRSRRSHGPPRRSHGPSRRSHGRSRRSHGRSRRSHGRSRRSREPFISRGSRLEKYCDLSEAYRDLSEKCYDELVSCRDEIMLYRRSFSERYPGALLSQPRNAERYPGEFMRYSSYLGRYPDESLSYYGCSETLCSYSERDCGYPQRVYDQNEREFVNYERAGDRLDRYQEFSERSYIRSANYEQPGKYQRYLPRGKFIPHEIDRSCVLKRREECLQRQMAYRENQQNKSRGITWGYDQTADENYFRG
ncbi:leucine zipper protein 4 isoform X2 [Echinops telfairi]|uniref:Leucine zipper protein 4 isoform X2 n=1 Tax=Echinops telfairi TaxID=9371 RepID=A0AC55DS31_ECHTE|nr:leucine zipper protein 4 isoform X2 [Echinops telfairi]